MKNIPLNYRRYISGGFTLIELLVVIAIISLLVSILLPSLKQVKDLAQSQLCKSNLRNLGLSFGFYHEDSSGKLIPIAVNVTGGGYSYNQTRVWRSLVMDYMDQDMRKVPGLRCPMEAGIVANIDIDYSSYHGKAIGTRPISYGINSASMLHDYFDTGRNNSLQDIAKPSDTIFCGDIGMPAASECNNPPEEWQTDIGGLSLGYMSFPKVYSSPSYFLFPRHVKTANALFYDGHVSDIRPSDDIIPYETGEAGCLFDNE